MGQRGRHDHQSAGGSRGLGSIGIGSNHAGEVGGVGLAQVDALVQAGWPRVDGKRLLDHQRQYRRRHGTR